MRTLKITVAYDGSGYQGFQKQPHGLAVQNILEEVFSKLCGEAIVTAGSGRTDAGVHALAQTVSFTTGGRIPCGNMVRAANSMLPKDIVVLEAQEVEEGFHARHSACWKEYHYHILINQQDNPFQAQYAWQLRQLLDVEAMNKAAGYLLGTHDFSSFRSSGSVDSSPIKTIYHAFWQPLPSSSLYFAKEQPLVFTIIGDGFLYHMVRNLVWSLVQVGLGKRPGGDFVKELNSQRCEFLNSPAPAQGLYLAQVGYSPYRKGEL